MSDGYRALHEKSAWFEIPGRGHIVVTGEDRKRLIHAMSTNDVENLGHEQLVYAFFLSPQGRILADANVLSLADALVLDTEPDTAKKLYDHLDAYIIADDAMLEDRTAAMTTIAIEGPRALESGAAAGVPVPAGDNLVVLWNDAIVTRLSATGQPAVRLFLPISSLDEFRRKLEGAGIPEAAPDTWRLVRIETGRPRYGDEITERYLAQETQVMRALHFQKGCYLGQEIVERVRSRGQVHRHLSRVQIAGQKTPEAGAKLTSGGKDAAEIVSAAFSPAMNAVAALAYVRTDFIPPGTELDFEGSSPARVLGPPV